MPNSEIGPTKAELDNETIKEILDRTSGRSRRVVEQILDHGYVTTPTLASLGYDHPPRAARDVRDRGIPLETVMKEVNNKKIAHYRFPDPPMILDRTASGRLSISKQFRQDVLDHYGQRDLFTGVPSESSELQIDHRIPFHISGDPVQPFSVSDFMPVSPAMNRVKSWECEACPNWNERQASVCSRCYWAGPDRPYEHIATTPTRRLDLVWQADEVEEFNRLFTHSEECGLEIKTAAKNLISQGLSHLTEHTPTTKN
ncbi:MAG: hypothetical protein OXE79_10635 [Acidimicrobiaceae bacterium]|nr:hypothetical protein [Acidimicrobiaceae bacterium]MCY4281096.1 hypothetical protein [Acidimicrobiaceae bacterium]MCY4295271.1 hypothetical protein [Acidimicrobiaceae bacterium]